MAVTLVVLGGGGHGCDVAALAVHLGVRGFFVLDEGDADPRRFAELPVELISDARHVPDGGTRTDFVAGIGYPDGRRDFVARATTWGWSPCNPLMHDNVDVGPGLTIGSGSVVMGQSWISPNVTLGEHLYVGYGAKIGHDVVVGDFASVFPGAFLAGDVAVGDGAMIGANSTVLQGVTVGEGCRVGAGAVVTRDVAPFQTVVGQPARSVDR